MDLALLSVVWVLAIVDSHIQTDRIEYCSVWRNNSVTLCVFIAGTGDLLTADQSIIAGILQRHAKFLLHCRNDHIVIVIQRDAAAAFCGLDRTFHQRIRCIFGHS